MSDPKYPSLHPWDLEPYYSEHVSAMTSEGLHSKADIAQQLAWRDKQLAAARKCIEAARQMFPARLTGHQQDRAEAFDAALVAYDLTTTPADAPTPPRRKA